MKAVKQPKPVEDKPSNAEAKKSGKDRRISLYPLSTQEALSDLLKVAPRPQAEKPLAHAPALRV